jgi:hypothetical protein
MTKYLKVSGLTILIFSGASLSQTLIDKNVGAYLLAFIPTFFLVMHVCYLALKK